MFGSADKPAAGTSVSVHILPPDLRSFDVIEVVQEREPITTHIDLDAALVPTPERSGEQYLLEVGAAAWLADGLQPSIAVSHAAKSFEGFDPESGFDPPCGETGGAARERLGALHKIDRNTIIVGPEQALTEEATGVLTVEISRISDHDDNLKKRGQLGDDLAKLYETALNQPQKYPVVTISVRGGGRNWRDRIRVIHCHDHATIADEELRNMNSDLLAEIRRRLDSRWAAVDLMARLPPDQLGVSPERFRAAEAGYRIHALPAVDPSAADPDKTQLPLRDVLPGDRIIVLAGHGMVIRGRAKPTRLWTSAAGGRMFFTWRFNDLGLDESQPATDPAELARKTQDGSPRGVDRRLIDVALRARREAVQQIAGQTWPWSESADVPMADRAWRRSGPMVEKKAEEARQALIERMKLDPRQQASLFQLASLRDLDVPGMDRESVRRLDRNPWVIALAAKVDGLLTDMDAKEVAVAGAPGFFSFSAMFGQLLGDQADQSGLLEAPEAAVGALYLLEADRSGFHKMVAARVRPPALFGTAEAEAFLAAIPDRRSPAFRGKADAAIELLKALASSETKAQRLQTRIRGRHITDPEIWIDNGDIQLLRDCMAHFDERMGALAVAPRPQATVETSRPAGPQDAIKTVLESRLPGSDRSGFDLAKIIAGLSDEQATAFRRAPEPEVPQDQLPARMVEVIRRMEAWADAPGLAASFASDTADGTAEASGVKDLVSRVKGTGTILGASGERLTSAARALDEAVSMTWRRLGSPDGLPGIPSAGDLKGFGRLLLLQREQNALAGMARDLDALLPEGRSRALIGRLEWLRQAMPDRADVGQNILDAISAAISDQSARGEVLARLTRRSDVPADFFEDVAR